MTAFPRNQLELPPSHSASAPLESHRRNPLQVIWLRRWIVIVVMILAMAVGAIQYYRATPMYQSRARVYVTQKLPKLMGADTDAELQQLYKKRLEFQQRNTDLSLGQDRSNAIVDRLNQLSVAATQAQLDVLRADSLSNSTKAMVTDPEKIRQLMNAPGFR